MLLHQNFDEHESDWENNEGVRGPDGRRVMFRVRDNELASNAAVDWLVNVTKCVSRACTVENEVPQMQPVPVR